VHGKTECLNCSYVSRRAVYHYVQGLLLLAYAIRLACSCRRKNQHRVALYAANRDRPGPESPNGWDPMGARMTVPALKPSYPEGIPVRGHARVPVGPLGVQNAGDSALPSGQRPASTPAPGLLGRAAAALGPRGASAPTGLTLEWDMPHQPHPVQAIGTLVCTASVPHRCHSTGGAQEARRGLRVRT
jgi:hypothetical protein